MKKRVHSKKILWLVILGLFLAGCATWAKPPSPFLNISAKYQVEIPWGWMKYRNEEFLLTRDGIWLENISIERFEIKKKLEHTKKQFIKDMLPDEIAEVELDDLRNNPDITNFKMIENVPADIGGRSGFKVIYSFRDKSELKQKVVHYGFAYDKWVYRIVYTAAADYYFDKNFADFDKLVKGFEFLEKKK